MSTEDNKAIARRFLKEAWADGNLASVEELAAPTISISYPYLGQPVHGLEAFKQVLLELHSELSDIALISEDDIIAEGDKVVVSWTGRGTYTDTFAQRHGKSVAGKQAVWTGMSIFRIVDGQIVEERGLEDERVHLRHLGLLPPHIPGA